jgi:hypothetical protein
VFELLVEEHIGTQDCCGDHRAGKERREEMKEGNEGNEGNKGKT